MGKLLVMVQLALSFVLLRVLGGLRLPFNHEGHKGSRRFQPSNLGTAAQQVKPYHYQIVGRDSEVSSEKLVADRHLWPSLFSRTHALFRERSLLCQRAFYAFQ
jgi:hypothetical protein